MKTCVFLSMVLYFIPVYLIAQPTCETEIDATTVQFSSIYQVYGASNRVVGLNNESLVTAGQPAVGAVYSTSSRSFFGIWAAYQQRPSAPLVVASTGDYADRISVQWMLDAFSSEATEGFIIRRNGGFLARVGTSTKEYIDFNVQPGEKYEYQVVGVNGFGEGTAGTCLGFVNPNGVVSGQLTSLAGTPVVNAAVRLLPNTNQSLSFDGVASQVCIDYHEQLLRDSMSLSFWVKIGDGNDRSGIIDLGSSVDKNFWITTTGLNEAKGIVLNVGGQSLPPLACYFADNPDGWHYVSIVQQQGLWLLAVDQQLTGTLEAPLHKDAQAITLGNTKAGTAPFKGSLDELRFFNTALGLSQLNDLAAMSVSGTYTGLTGYWKFNEGTGDKAFDFSSFATNGILYQASFSNDAPEVFNAASTDDGGFYLIEGIDYSQNQSFTVQPVKYFYNDYAIEFKGQDGANIQLPAQPVKGTGTLELLFHPFVKLRNQSLLKGEGNASPVAFYMQNGELVLEINGESKILGPANMEYTHVALTIDTINNEVKYFRQGALENTISYTDLSNWGQVNDWIIGAPDAARMESPFIGLIDEWAVYDTLLSQSDIQLHASSLLDGTTIFEDPRLQNYFPFSDGADAAIRDYGYAMSGQGTSSQVIYSTRTFRQTSTPHDFSPSRKVVNINLSNTAIGNVNFSDVSTINVSGVVRFSDTYCYASNVEILVNGQSYLPPIMTDEQGRWSADFDPGADIRLTPKFEDHAFLPAFFDIDQLNQPVAGVLFQDVTKRKVVGQLAGGDCRQSIIPEGAIVKVKAQSLNGCFEKEITLTNRDGNYVIDDLPPIPYAVVVTEHSNNVIKDFFQNKGGVEIDLTKQEQDTVDFIYFAPPQVVIEDFPENDCGYKIVNQAQSYTRKVQVYEEYDGGVCYLDSALLTIDNAIADADQYEVRMDTNFFDLTFTAGLPFLAPPYEKNLQVTATAKGSSSSASITAVVAGRSPRTNTFASKSPQVPFIILHDPPGDGSYAYLEENSTVCSSFSVGITAGGSLEDKLEVSIGGDIEFATGIGFEKTTKIEVKNTNTITSTLTYEAGYSNNAEFCLTTERRYQTSAIDDLPGGGQDVFVGAAINFLYGITDNLEFVDSTCTFQLDNTVTIFPEEFDTEFIYTRDHIVNVLIPALVSTGDTTAAEAWQQVLREDSIHQAEAVFEKNLSFSGGTVYEQSQTSTKSQTQSFSFTTKYSNELETVLGGKTDGIGVEKGVKTTFSFGASATAQQNETNSRKTGFVLFDDEVQDNFTVDVLEDKYYATPAFRLVSGQSRCPWEAGTQNRQQLDLTIDRRVATNVPSRDAATFTVTLANTSPAGQTQPYILAIPTGTNPKGADIDIIGAAFNTPIQLLPNSSKDFTVTVGRGPDDYDYTDLTIAAYAQCEYEFAIDFGTDPRSYDTTVFDQNPFYQEEFIDVHFIEPCSEIDLAMPSNNVITPADGDVFFFTLNSYNLSDPDLDSVRVQYRRQGGDGAWINIKELPKDSLGPVFTIVPWDTEGLVDAVYEVRAITECTSVSLSPGVSSIIPIRIERQGPKLFGTPQPADGVLSPGDEISIQFTKRIDCNQVFLADGIGTNINNNNLGLYDETTNTLIDAEVTCNDDKLIIVPNIQNKFIENKSLRVQVEGIKDLVGNTLESPVSWSFFVNRSGLYWKGGGVDEVVQEGDQLVIERYIQNQAGTIFDYTIENIPEWMTVSPASGSIEPGAFETVTITFPSDLVNGSYTTTLDLRTYEGVEPLEVALRVACPSPDWTVNPLEYSYSMNLVLQLDIDGDLSVDALDHVAALIDHQVRGVAYVEYVPALDTYLAFLTVYSNSLDPEQLVEFQVWDASTCERHADIIEEYLFVADGFVGAPLSPQVIHTDNRVRRSRIVYPGWNWLSYNVAIPEPDIAKVLSSLDNPIGAVVKGQLSFAQYFAAADLWIGSLSQLSHTQMYQYQSPRLDTLVVVGNPIDPDQDSIPLHSGWNWIGYYPQQGMSVNEALGGFTPLNGDLIKSQTGFAQYVAGAGWIGNLQFMAPMEGYQLQLAQKDTLKFPKSRAAAGRLLTPPDSQLLSAIGHWMVDARYFEHSMNIVATVLDSTGQSCLAEQDEVALFAKDKLVGVGRAIWVAPRQEYQVFLTAFSDTGLPEVFRAVWYDASAKKEQLLQEVLSFERNAIVGSVDAPFLLSIDRVTELAAPPTMNFAYQLSPNPASDRAVLQVVSPGSIKGHWTLSDLNGRLIKQQALSLVQGVNFIHLELNPLPVGVYVLSTRLDNGYHFTEKLQITH